MKHLCAFLVLGNLLMCSLTSPAQGYDDCISLWNGFSQTWGYNHRLARLGDWVRNPESDSYDCSVTIGHAAASGSGSDQAVYRTYATAIAANGVHFGTGSLNLSLEGRENEWLIATAEGSYFDPWIGEAGVETAVVLGGFDLYSSPPAKADKLRDLEFGVDTFWTDSATHTLHFRLRARTRLACSSSECGWFENEVAYQLRLDYVAVVGAGFVRHEAEFARQIVWTKDSLPDSAAVAASILGTPGYPVGGLGIRSFQVHLDRETHFVDWRSFLRPGLYDAAGGRYAFDLGLHFAQWAPGQYAAYSTRYSGKPRLPAKWAVQRRAGEAQLAMEVTLLQFRDGMAKPMDFEGKIDWLTRPARQAPVTDSMAVHEFLFFEF